MKATSIVAVVFALAVCFGRAEAHDRTTHTVRGAVITADGAMVDHFMVVVRPVTDKPILINRYRFTKGLFELGLSAKKYELVITAPRFTGVRLELDFPKNSDSTDFKVVILHGLRSDLASPDPVGTLNVQRFEANIPEPAKIRYRQGVQLHANGQLDEALGAYRDAMMLSPTFVPPIIDTAAIYLLFDHPQAATVYLRRALVLDPKNLAARINMAAALLVMKDFDSAIKQAKSMLNESADPSLPRILIAKAYFLQKKYVQAEEMAALITGENPQFLDGWQLRLNIALERKDYIAARENLLKMRDAMHNTTFSKFVDDQIGMLTAATNN